MTVVTVARSKSLLHRVATAVKMDDDTKLRLERVQAEIRLMKGVVRTGTALVSQTTREPVGRT